LMDDGVSARIPLHAQDGSVKAYAVIDAVDAECVGQFRWSLDSNGYAMRRHLGKRITLHRVLLGLTGGDGVDGDHIDRDRLNNRRLNLRPVTRAQNAQNQGRHDGSISQFRGVTWHKTSRKWQAQIRTNGKNIKLGCFEDESDAAEAARAARARLMPYATD
jgi:hypothetical protein